MTKDKGTGQLFASEELRRAAKLLVEARQARSEREGAERLRQAQRLLGRSLEVTQNFPASQ